MTSLSTVNQCRSLTLRTHSDGRGKLTIVEAGTDIPFEIKRVFYLHDVPPNTERGGHAHRELHQGFVAISGALTILLDDGGKRRRVDLTNPYELLHVPPGVWVDVVGFAQGAICVVFASAAYQESDYLRSYSEFLTYRGARPREP